MVEDILHDPQLKDAIDYHAKPLFQDGSRVFGPLSSGVFWETMEVLFPDKTIILGIPYSDLTMFRKGASAWPVFCKNLLDCS